MEEQYLFAFNSNARRRCTVHREVNWQAPRENTGRQNDTVDFSEPLDRRDTYFPLRLHKPPGEAIETAIERPPRFFSPHRVHYVHLVATNEYATFPPRRTTDGTLDNKVASSMRSRAFARKCEDANVLDVVVRARFSWITIYKTAGDDDDDS